MKRRETFHVGYSPGRTDEPLPVTFYVSPELFEDADAVPADQLAELLKPYLALAIEQHRAKGLDA
jgi:hypothetical protein